MKNKNLIWGLFFILAGVALILDRTGLLGSVSVWSVVISLLLVPVIVTSVRHLNFWGIFFPMAIMAILFDETLGIEKFTPWRVLGAALLLSVGFSFIFPYRYRFTQSKWTTHTTDNPAWDKSSDNGGICAYRRKIFRLHKVYNLKGVEKSRHKLPLQRYGGVL